MRKTATTEETALEAKQKRMPSLLNGEAEEFGSQEGQMN